jgi:hypothetical protein
VKEASARRAGLVGVDLGVGEARVVIDRCVDVVETEAPMGGVSVPSAERPVAPSLGDPGQLLHITGASPPVGTSQSRTVEEGSPRVNNVCGNYS